MDQTIRYSSSILTVEWIMSGNMIRYWINYSITEWKSDSRVIKSVGLIWYWIIYKLIGWRIFEQQRIYPITQSDINLRMSDWYRIIPSVNSQMALSDYLIRLNCNFLPIRSKYGLRFLTSASYSLKSRTFSPTNTGWNISLIFATNESSLIHQISNYIVASK